MRMVHSLLQTKASSAKFWECKSEWDSIPLIWTTYSLAETRNDMVVAGLGEDEEHFQRCYLKLSARRGLERELVLAATYPPGQVGQGRLLADWVLGYLVSTCWPARDRLSEIPIRTTPSKSKLLSVSTKLLWATNRLTGQAGLSAHVPDAVCCNATGLQVPGCLLLVTQGVFTTNTAHRTHPNSQHVHLLDRADGPMGCVTSWAN